MFKILSILSTLSLSAAFMSTAPLRQPQATSVRMAEEIFDQEAFIAEGREMRLKHLEDQAMFALKIACENYGMFASVVVVVVIGMPSGRSLIIYGG